VRKIISMMDGAETEERRHGDVRRERMRGRGKRLTLQHSAQ
jgi:hypothetical protein